MNKKPEQSGPDQSDESIGRLLQAVGSRESPSTLMTEEVRRAVHEEWRTLVAQRHRRQRVLGYGVAASVVAAAIAVGMSWQLTQAPPATIGSVARVDGDLEVALDGGRWRSMTTGERVPEGAILRTDAGSRAALDVAGVSLRMDADSVITLSSAHEVALTAGAVYVDAAPAMAQVPLPETLVIDTSYGSVRHVGTQYEVRSTRDGIEVSVREGLVQIARADRTYAGRAGEQLVLRSDGEPERHAVTAQDPRWQWATAIAPVFDIERRPLVQFLDWVARETGKTIVYASPEVRVRAERLILRGSVSDLPPEQALAAVLATTPFTHAAASADIRIDL